LSGDLSLSSLPSLDPDESRSRRSTLESLLGLLPILLGSFSFDDGRSSVPFEGRVGDVDGEGRGAVDVLS